MNCLSIRAEIDVPGTPAFPAPTFPNPPLPAVPTVEFVHAGLVDVVVVGERLGIVGIDEFGPVVPTEGNTLGSGTAGVELTPRLPISKDPSGSPVRAAPPGAVGDVDVGLDDAAMLLEPEPHIPDIPEVSSVPEDVDVDIPDDADIPDDVDIPAMARVPGSTALAGAAAPAAIPPPS
jgi:hypothetical protein